MKYTNFIITILLTCFCNFPTQAMQGIFKRGVFIGAATSGWLGAGTIVNKKLTQINAECLQIKEALQNNDKEQMKSIMNPADFDPSWSDNVYERVWLYENLHSLERKQKALKILKILCPIDLSSKRNS